MPANDEPCEDPTFEAAMESLDAIVASLEGERLPLEDMVASYERGMKLLRVCRSRIETARQRVELITADLEGRGKATLSDFSASEASSSSSESDDAPKRQPRKKPAPAEPPPPDTTAEPGEIRLF
jgi:exodeoxyribonuclease VII small subunit